MASAWTGLGAAILTLWRQAKSPSYVIGLIQVTLYLVSVSSLHITTPSLFSVQSFQSSVATVAGITGVPKFNASYVARIIFNLEWWLKTNMHNLVRQRPPRTSCGPRLFHFSNSKPVMHIFPRSASNIVQSMIPSLKIPPCFLIRALAHWPRSL